MVNIPQNIHFVGSKETIFTNVIALRSEKQTSQGNKLRKVPSRPKNRDVRSREYLLADEIESLMKAAGSVGRHRLRDRSLILVGYRHALRVSELVRLKWDQVDFRCAQMHIHRLKNGSPATHPIEGDELRLLRRLRRQYPETPFVFTTERGGPPTRSTASKIMTRAGREAGLPFPVHPHMLRHSTGYYLANKGVPTRTIQAYLGHRSIQHTVRYTELSAKAFERLWA